MHKTLGSVAIVALVLPAAAWAQEQSGTAGTAGTTGQVVSPPAAVTQPAPEVPKRYTVTVGVDAPTAYMFRGIHQESIGFIAEPPIDLGVTLNDRVTLNVGQWHSIHSGPTGHFYESDYYGSLTLTAGKLKPGILFTSYTSPNARFGTVQELAGFVSYDDSGSRFPLAPKATIAFELDGQADGGTAEGTYLELAIRPSVKLIDGRLPLSLAVPVRTGISLKDYYEGAAGSDTFGFFSTGLMASVPVTKGKVTWDLHGGIDVCRLGRNLKALNGGDAFKPIGVFGVTLTY
jgi:hypothetical protein